MTEKRTAKVFQSNFTRGEVGPRLTSRTDLEAYYNGLTRMRNFIVFPQGGATRRSGLRLVENITGDIVDSTQFRFWPFPLSDSLHYIQLHCSDFVKVYREKENKVTLVPSAGDWYLDQHIPEVRVVQEQDVMITAHRAAPPIRFIRFSDGVWRAAPIDQGRIVNMPTLTFVTPVPHTLSLERKVKIGGVLGTSYYSELRTSYYSDRKKAVSATGVFAPTDVGRFIVLDAPLNAYSQIIEYVDTNEVTVEWPFKRLPFGTGGTANDVPVSPTVIAVNKWSIEVVSDVATDVGLLVRIPTARFAPATTSRLTVPSRPDPGTNVIVTASGNEFVSTDVGKYIVGAYGGVGKIVLYTSATQVTMEVLDRWPIELDGDPAAAPDPMEPGAWSIEEEVWSDSRGWPGSLVTHDGRLYFASTYDIPNGIWGSVTFDVFNFALGQSRDDDSVQMAVNSKSLAIIQDLVSGRHLIALSSSNEVYMSSNPITPGNALPVESSNRGALNVPPINVDGVIIYLGSGGKSLRELIYNRDVQSYESNELSVLSSHLYNNPYQLTFRKSVSSEKGDTILILNGDGTVIAFTAMRNEEVNAYSLLSTEGEVLAIGVDESNSGGHDVYFLVKRDDPQSPGDYIYTVEVMDDDYILDSSVRTTVAVSTDTFTGLDHLDGRTVKVMVNDFYEESVAVSSGTAVLSRSLAIGDVVEFGIDYPELALETLDPAPAQNEVSFHGEKKRISEVWLDLFDTTSVSVEGEEANFHEVSEYVENTNAPFTGLYRFTGIQGWDRKKTVTVTQQEPGKLTLLGLSLRVTF